MMSLSNLVGKTCNLQDLVGMDIIIFSTTSSVSLVKFTKDLLLLCCVGLNLGQVSSASLIVLILFMKKSSKIPSQFLITHGGG